jgi:hypothetical protein
MSARHRVRSAAGVRSSWLPCSAPPLSLPLTSSPAPALAPDGFHTSSVLIGAIKSAICTHKYRIHGIHSLRSHFQEQCHNDREDIKHTTAYRANIIASFTVSDITMLSRGSMKKKRTCAGDSGASTGAVARACSAPLARPTDARVMPGPPTKREATRTTAAGGDSSGGT